MPDVSAAATGNPSRSELAEILGRLNDIRSILECGTRLLECGEGSARSDRLDEAVCLRHGLSLLSAVYDSLDRAIITMRQQEC